MLPQAGGTHTDQRVAHLEQRAIANGITPIRSRPKSGAPGQIIAFGEPQKTEAELFKDHLPAGSSAFRFLCGYVHSKPWVLVPRHRARASSDPKVSNISTDLDVTLFAAVLNGVLDLHDENIGYWLALAGYPSEVWRLAKQGAGP